jgi:hypothetical protein
VGVEEGLEEQTEQVVMVVVDMLMVVVEIEMVLLIQEVEAGVVTIQGAGQAVVE